MKSMTVVEAAANIEQVITSAQKERIVLTRNGRPSAVIVGLEAYDEEDLRLASSPAFWKTIEDRRRTGAVIPLAKLKAKLRAAKPRRPSPKKTKKKTRNGAGRKRSQF
jgi:prevent-host-death family protein